VCREALPVLLALLSRLAPADPPAAAEDGGEAAAAAAAERPRVNWSAAECALHALHHAAAAAPAAVLTLCGIRGGAAARGGGADGAAPAAPDEEAPARRAEMERAARALDAQCTAYVAKLKQVPASIAPQPTNPPGLPHHHHHHHFSPAPFFLPGPNSLPCSISHIHSRPRRVCVCVCVF
jgi:hypothetical protein